MDRALTIMLYVTMHVVVAVICLMSSGSGVVSNCI
jgi:hypothetical protein